MMNTLQFMSSRGIQKKIDWHTIEKDGFVLPPIYKIFHDTYDISTMLQHPYRYYNEEYKMYDVFVVYTHVLMPLLLEYLFIPEELEQVLPQFLYWDGEPDIELYEKNVIPIAAGYGDVILLGVGLDNSDLIYHYSRTSRRRIEQIANNVFEFFKGYYVKIEEAYLRGKKVEDFYQNWGENFWRSKPEGDITHLIEQKNLEIKTLYEERDKYKIKLIKLARREKEEGIPLSVISAKYDISEEELSKSYF